MAPPWPRRSHSHCRSSVPLRTALLFFGSPFHPRPQLLKVSSSFSSSSSFLFFFLFFQLESFTATACAHGPARVRAWCLRSMGTGFCGCQLQSALTCASNVVYCLNTSPEENLSRPLKFKAIYHPRPQPHLRSLSCPPALPVSHHPSLPPPPPHPVSASPPPRLSPSITSMPSPSHWLELKFRRD